MIWKIFSKSNAGRDEKRYAIEKKQALSNNPIDRLKLAKNKNTHQEILYYLAQNDGDARVREAVAKNKATPVQASPVLAKDKEFDVRLALTNRLLKLLPHLTEDKHSQLYAFAVEALGTLALDEVLKIRMAMSSALRDYAQAPPTVVGQLARDLEREVSEPILRYCVALSDEDLLDILKNHPAAWAVQAIAARPNVSENVSEAVIEAEDVPAGVTLLDNKTANIALRTMTTIVEKAKTITQWQKPIALRKNLPKELALELAQFVDESVRRVLMTREDFDEGTRADIEKVVKRRIDFIEKSETEKIPATERVKQLLKERKLNEDVITDALGLHDKEFVIASLAALNRTSIPNMEKVFDLQTPKPVMAVCWNAGLSMRLAFQMQKSMAQIQPKELVYPRGGTDYPVESAELKWQLEFFGIAVQGNKG